MSFVQCFVEAVISECSIAFGLFSLSVDQTHSPDSLGIFLSVTPSVAFVQCVRDLARVIRMRLAVGACVSLPSRALLKYFRSLGALGCV